ncbi:MAG: hypothetical protein ACI4JS_07820 [Oscillospiraceae bacterium]
MHIPEGFDNWQELYRKEIIVAEKELALKNFDFNPQSLIGDIYVLPSSNHQTFYGKLVKGIGFIKFIFVKPIQNSVWFSEPVYQYTISEAKRFEDHPMRHGRLICHADFIDMNLIAEASLTIKQLEDKQPDEVVVPNNEATFTAVRFFKDGITTHQAYFTDATKLVFKDGSDNPEAVQFLQKFYLEIEKILGIGE